MLPDRVAPGPDHHAALDRAVVRELRVEDDVDVPLRVVNAAGGDLLCHAGDLLLTKVREYSRSREGSSKGGSAAVASTARAQARAHDDCHAAFSVGPSFRKRGARQSSP